MNTQELHNDLEMWLADYFRENISGYCFKDKAEVEIEDIDGEGTGCTLSFSYAGTHKRVQHNDIDCEPEDRYNIDYAGTATICGCAFPFSGTFNS